MKRGIIIAMLVLAGLVLFVLYEQLTVIRSAAAGAAATAERVRFLPIAARLTA